MGPHSVGGQWVLTQWGGSGSSLSGGAVGPHSVGGQWVLISVLAIIVTESFPVWQFVFKVKAQHSFSCCDACFVAALQSFYFDKL